jgi:hypothetical protein
MLVAAPRHRDGVSAGCAPSGVALHRREHQGCRRGAQVFGDEDLLCRIVFHMKGGQTRLDRLADVGRYRRRAVDPAEHVREGELVIVGEVPVDRSALLILLLYLDKRGRPRGTDSRQTKVGPEEKIPPLGCGAQHEH